MARTSGTWAQHGRLPKQSGMYFLLPSKCRGEYRAVGNQLQHSSGRLLQAAQCRCHSWLIPVPWMLIEPQQRGRGKVSPGEWGKGKGTAHVGLREGGTR